MGKERMVQHVGKVVWFNNAKGYGFLKYEGGVDVFCHYSAIQKDGYKVLREGDDVEFDIVKDETGREQAANVSKVAEVP
jgi:cold shock protein